MKWELEDLACATSYPQRLDEIARSCPSMAERQDVSLQEVMQEVRRTCARRR